MSHHGGYPSEVFLMRISSCDSHNVTDAPLVINLPIDVSQKPPAASAGGKKIAFGAYLILVTTAATGGGGKIFQVRGIF